MQPLFDFGISLVIVVQRMGEWVYPIMTFFSDLGSEEFFFLAMPLIYWCIDSALGLRVGFILVTSIYLTTIGKAAFAGPRPYGVGGPLACRENIFTTNGPRLLGIYGLCGCWHGRLRLVK